MILRLVLGCLLLSAAAMAASPAWAHAVLVEAAPADGAVLAQPPSAVHLRFNEPVSPVAVQVLDAAGAAVAGLEAVTVDDGDLHIALPAGLADGSYLVSYRVRSLDAHPVAGTLVFSVGAAAGPSVPAAAPDAGRDEAWLAAYAVNRVLFYVSLTAAAGGVFFLVLVLGAGPGQARLRALVRAGAAGGIATALLGVGLKGATLVSPPLSGLLAGSTWRAGAETSLGPSIAVVVPALLLAALLAGSPRGWRAVASLAAAVAAVASLSLTGHAATAEPRWLMGPALALHGLMAAFWVGSLWGLLIVLRAGDANAAAGIVRRFSRRAVPAVLLLLAAAVALAVVQVAAVPALVATGYGRALLVKVGLAGILLAVALYNNRRLSPRLARGDADARAGLRRTIRIELALVLAIFGATAVLGSVPPPRTGPAAEVPAVSVAIEARGNVATVALQPGTAGTSVLTVHLAGPDGRPLEPQSVSVALENAAAGIAPIRRDGQAHHPGTYVVTGLPLALAGRWTVRIDVLVSDFEKLIFSAEIELR